MKHALYGSVIASVVFCLLVFRGASTEPASECYIDFQILTDQLIYAPASTAHLKFIVRNISETPLYLARPLADCSSQRGFVHLQMLDREGKNVNMQTCSADSWPPLQQRDVLKLFSDPKLWLFLMQGEIYGGGTDFVLPDKRGKYQLEAEITPPALSDTQKDILSRNRVRVLVRACSAPSVTIAIK